MGTTRRILAELREQGARFDRKLDELRAEREAHEARWERLFAGNDARWADRIAENEARRERRDAELQDVIRFNTEAFRRSELAFEDFRKEQREAREDIRAQTRAILAVLDRLEGGGAAPAT